MKHLYSISLLTLLMLLPARQAFAVTEKEMEEARTITAQAYLRYANDGSGYLDQHHPKTMADLQKVLKEKEKENLKSFTAVPLPSGYESWTKDQLVAYWGGTFFNSPGLLAKGKVGKSRAKARVAAMNVTSAADLKKAEEAKKEAEAKKAEEAKKAAEAKDTVKAEEMIQAAEAVQRAAEAVEAADAAVEQANADAGVEPQPHRQNSSTWVYILILGALVVVVVWLVIYASNTMKIQGRRRGSDEAYGAVGALTLANEKALEQKDIELRQAARALAEMRAAQEQAASALNAVTAERDALRAECEALRSEFSSLRSRMQARLPEPAEPAETTAARQTPGATDRRLIYLGRVNQRGFFVRADRQLNPEHSVYVLETEDGFSGTFRVVARTDVDRRLLSSPMEWLAGGCVGHSIDNPGNATQIRTEVSGTAIFEGGVWKVIRKARISYV